MAGLTLGQNAGPLPLGVWIGIGAVGLGIGYVINKKMAKSVATQEPSSTQLTESGVGTGGGQFVYTPPTNTSDTTVPETNQTWGTKATNWLISQNTDPALADQAVRKYLSAQPLTAAEKATINLVLIHFGAPPEPLPPVDDTNVPTTPVLTAPTANAVNFLHVNRASRRNDLVWSDNSSSPVTHFIIRATANTTGNSIAATVPAISGHGDTYTWSHFAWPGSNTPIMYTYEVTPYNGITAGPTATVQAQHLM